MEDYQETLWEWPGDVRNTACRYSRGKLAGLRGDRERALALMREAEQMASGARQWRLLAKVHRLAFEGRIEEARRALQAFQNDRMGLRVPDGEITLNIAEAYVLLGDNSKAMEMARLAFSQGFGCTRWYETDAALAPLRSHPQWPWLLQHLNERQALYESRFRKENFGL